MQGNAGPVNVNPFRIKMGRYDSQDTIDDHDGMDNSPFILWFLVSSLWSLAHQV